MRIRFLGSGDAFGSGGRLQTCILMESGAVRCLIDCGASSLIALKRAVVDPNEIDTILVTHLHGDHFGGIPFLILDGQFSRRSRPLLVGGPPGLTERVNQAMEVLFPGSSRAKRRFDTDFLEIPEGIPTTVGPLRVTPHEVVHACGAPPYALRVELDGRTVVYSGDTEWTDRLIQAVAGADLFICEAYFHDKSVPFHLDYATLARHRSRFECKRLIVTHMSADMLARIPDLPVEAAYDGLEISCKRMRSSRTQEQPRNEVALGGRDRGRRRPIEPRPLDRLEPGQDRARCRTRTHHGAARRLDERASVDAPCSASG